VVDDCLISAFLAHEIVFHISSGQLSKFLVCIVMSIVSCQLSRSPFEFLFSAFPISDFGFTTSDL